MITEAIRIEKNIPTKMRDGTTLYCDIWLPNINGKLPAILTRLPYGKDMLFSTKGSGYMNFQRFALAGYAVIIQDCRGTGVSEGEFHPWQKDDQNDGYDTIEWIAMQPWCNGNIGMYGPSHLCYTQWAAALTQPPHLKTICPAQGTAILRESPYSKNGVLYLQMLIGWCLNLTANKLNRSNLPQDELKKMRDQLLFIMDHIEEQFHFLPLRDVPGIKESGMRQFYLDNIDHIVDALYWEKHCSPIQIDNINIPVFHMDGWYDHKLALTSVLNNYTTLKKSSSDIVRNNQKLLVGPWLHGTDLLGTVGDLNFGLRASGTYIDVTGIHIKWFDHWLKGMDNGITKEPPVRLFIMGDNLWRDEKEWPLERTEYTKYFFHSRGYANSCYGDGELNTSEPVEEPADVYLYDPRNPVPSIAEFVELKDHQKLEERTDILIYTSDSLKSDLEVTGPVSIILFAASSAVDTDFTGKLIDIWPDGKAYNLVDGVVRARYRKSLANPVLITPGKIYKYFIDLGATANVFKKGHRIRIEISSSSFPKWDRNQNTGHPLGQDAEIKAALQTIYHAKKYPSHILLPVIPKNLNQSAEV